MKAICRIVGTYLPYLLNLMTQQRKLLPGSGIFKNDWPVCNEMEKADIWWTWGLALNFSAGLDVATTRAVFKHKQQEMRMTNVAKTLVYISLPAYSFSTSLSFQAAFFWPSKPLLCDHIFLHLHTKALIRRAWTCIRTYTYLAFIEGMEWLEFIFYNIDKY